jgi:uncharacterized protein YecT (DUF1311 family)
MALGTANAHAQPASNPSFDCRKATTPVEKLICSVPELGALDRKMAEAFRQILAEAPVANRPAIIDSQLDWMQDRATGCGLGPRQPAFHMLDFGSPAQCVSKIYERWFKNVADRVGPEPRWHRTELPFRTTRQPFTPRLLVSHDAALCDAFLRGLRQDFLARHNSYHGQGKRVFQEPPMSLGRWIDWPSEHSARGYSNPAAVDVAELDLDQNGQRQLLIHVTEPFGSRGDSYLLFVSSKTATDGLSDEIRNFTNPSLKDRRPTPIRAVDPYTYGGYIFGYASPVKVLAYRGGMYLYQSNDVTSFFQSTGTATLNRIHADGSTDLRCEAAVVPKANTPRQPRTTDRLDVLTVPDEAVKWLATIREIQGGEGKFPGSLHALRELSYYSSIAGYDALVRPWEVATGRRPYEPSATGMRSWIRQWGYNSLSQYRLARVFEADDRAALAALATYYERSFGVPNGKEAAQQITDSVISQSFFIGGIDQDKYEPPPKDTSGLLREALLTGSPPDEINRLIDAGAMLTESPERGIRSFEPMLFYALEHPDEVRLLLDKGADVNEGNAFGKTALMYAAHYDLSDTMALLLAHGADVTKRTDATKVMEVNLQYDSRTALMYAAENASERVIDLLIQAGADVCAVDSGKRDVRDYLSRNQRLPDATHTRFVDLISAKSCDTASQGVPK